MHIQDYCDIAEGALLLRAPLQQFIRGNLITDNREMLRQLTMLERSGQGNIPLTILGEKGSGKNFIAQYAHTVSARSNAPFIKTNCAYYPGERMELELFGSGTHGNPGLLNRATGGSLYIENIDRLPSAVQYQLIEHIHTTEGKKHDIRFMICLQDQSPENRESGLIEQMGYYFNTMLFDIPPLRRRPEDILLLTFQQLQKIKQDYHIVRQISPAVMSAMLSYEWPTNIRQLNHTVERLALLSDETLLDSVPLLQKCLSTQKQLQTPDIETSFPSEAKSLKEIVQDYEMLVINQYIERCGSIRKAAIALKSSSSTLSRKITEYYAPSDKENKK